MIRYADPGYQADKEPRYPLNTESRVRAAWGYINHPANARRYTARQRQLIHQRIQAAGRRYGIQFAHARTKASTMLGRTADRTARRRGDR